MKNGTQALRPGETSLIIQARIEGIAPKQVLERDKAVRDGGNCAELTAKAQEAFRAEEDKDWNERNWSIENSGKP